HLAANPDLLDSEPAHLQIDTSERKNKQRAGAGDGLGSLEEMGLDAEGEEGEEERVRWAEDVAAGIRVLDGDGQTPKLGEKSKKQQQGKKKKM
ncbi:MAG: hypothetical protein Q9195_001230, partial [Heterodermia aff. obscurata]